MKLPKPKVIFLVMMMKNLMHHFCQNRQVTQVAKVRRLAIRVTHQIAAIVVAIAIQNLTTVRPAQHQVVQMKIKIKRKRAVPPKKPKKQTLT